MLSMKRCNILPVKMTSRYPNIQEEADTCSIFTLTCLNTRTSPPDASTTIVTSKVIGHRCISTAYTILKVMT